LSGLSVGLGAVVPNFRETDPSKIAVGAGGTLNLIVGLLYLLTVILLMTGPFHLIAGLNGGTIPPSMRVWIALGAAAGALLAGAATIVPLRMGARVLNRIEF
jgi:ABC-2 type transport system permease protein